MSQIATSIEQSKRLLKAGLDPESADMWWTIVQPRKQAGWKLVPDGQPYSMLNLYKEEHLGLASYEDIPAWSLSRLWGLASEKGLFLEFNTKEDTTDGIVDILVDCIADPIIKIMDDLKDGKI